MAKRKKKPYKHPIPSRNELISFLEKSGKPQKIKNIIEGMGLKGQRTRALLEDRLPELQVTVPSDGSTIDLGEVFSPARQRCW